MEKKSQKMSPLARGLVVFLLLALLTAVEYVLGVAQVAAIFLWTVAIVKAALVLWFFMHISRLFGGEEDHS